VDPFSPDAPAWLHLLLVGGIGLCIGSFLNVVVHRLPRMLARDWRQQAFEVIRETEGERLPRPEEGYDLVKPRSHCPACGHMITAWENIPVVSYLVLRGRCRGCGAHISLRYPLVEALTGALSIVVLLQFGWGWVAAWALIYTWGLLALTFIDFDRTILPDNITLPLLWLGLLVNTQGLFTTLTDAIYGAAAGYLALWSIYWAFKLVTGKEGMGYGDFKLLSAVGAWLGWQLLPLTILLSSFVGAIVGLALILFRRHDRAQPIPFGPFLAAGGWIALMWGDWINQQYLNLTF
jgi:leader peptidase (prepilin peptidase)/N-methyltransferase